ncbi:MAG: hypothetical protein K5912_00160 [Alphaproteobacteria bacterium]|nr:hypothetical protein [Alphaproteobacteria bacterium]
MIIKTDYLFENINDIVALWLQNQELDNSVLVRVSDIAIENNVSKMSVPTGVVERIWPWLEKNRINLVVRFDFANFYDGDLDLAVSNIAKDISLEFRHGASGVQILLSKSNIDAFVNGILPIRQDLFFGKDFSVAMNIGDCGVSDWPKIFDALNKIRADSLLLIAKGEKFDAKSDFVGRIYAMLENWNTSSGLAVMFGKNMMRVGQTIRLLKKMRPELVRKTTVFMED